MTINNLKIHSDLKITNPGTAIIIDKTNSCSKIPCDVNKNIINTGCPNYLFLILTVD